MPLAVFILNHDICPWHIMKVYIYLLSVFFLEGKFWEEGLYVVHFWIYTVFWSKRCWKFIDSGSKLFEVHAYFGDIAESVPDHWNKVSITLKWVPWNLWFPRTYKSYVCTILYSVRGVIALYIYIIYIHTLIKNALLMKMLNIIWAFSEL